MNATIANSKLHVIMNMVCPNQCVRFQRLASANTPKHLSITVRRNAASKFSRAARRRAPPPLPCVGAMAAPPPPCAGAAAVHPPPPACAGPPPPPPPCAGAAAVHPPPPAPNAGGTAVHPPRRCSQPPPSPQPPFSQPSPQPSQLPPQCAISKGKVLCEGAALCEEAAAKRRSEQRQLRGKAPVFTTVFISNIRQ